MIEKGAVYFVQEERAKRFYSAINRTEAKLDETPEQRRDVRQFRDTSLTKGYVSSIDELFMRGCNPLIRENSYFDRSVDNHTMTGIRAYNGGITEIYFYC